MNLKRKLSALIVTLMIVFIAIPQDSALADTCTIGTYNQTEARKLFDMINSFRMGSDAWYWDKDNSAKIYCENLEPLKYDANLEKLAMQRAIELAARFDHIRPDGTRFYSVYAQYGVKARGCSENIAYGFDRANSVNYGFREDNEKYAGQGHRRNMLNYSYNAVGIACVVVNGTTYWAEEFAYLDKITSCGKAVNGNQTMFIPGDDNSEYNTSVNGLTQINGTWYYMKKSKLDNGYTGLCKYNGNWYYVQKGVLNWNYTGLCKYNGTWWYVHNGMVDFKATALCKYNGTWWYVHNGAVDFRATTLCKYNGTWWYVHNGAVDFKATTLCKYNGTWWYVHNGAVDFKSTTLCKYSGTWWYVHNGAVDFKATTLCQYNGTWWYVRGGQVNFSATTLCRYNGTWWYVHNGAVDFKAITLCKYNGTWWYVLRGQVDWNSRTLVKYGNTWYYVCGGQVGWNYTGYCEYNGADYYIKKGVVSSSSSSNTASTGTVYITETGEKYHRDGCRSLRKSKIPKSKSEAIAQGYEACDICKP